MLKENEVYAEEDPNGLLVIFRWQVRGSPCPYLSAFTTFSLIGAYYFHDEILVFYCFKSPQ